MRMKSAGASPAPAEPGVSNKAPTIATSVIVTNLAIFTRAATPGENAGTLWGRNQFDKRVRRSDSMTVPPAVKNPGMGETMRSSVIQSPYPWDDRGNYPYIITDR